MLFGIDKWLIPDEREKDEARKKGKEDLMSRRRVAQMLGLYV